MTRTLMAFSTIFLLSGPPAHAAKNALEPEAVKTAQAFFTNLENDIQAALANVEGGRDRLLARGRLPRDLNRELDKLIQLTREAGGLESVRINTFMLGATVRYGIVPLKEIDLHMIRTPDRLRLLRSVVRDTHRQLFVHDRRLTWPGDEAEAFRTLAAQMTRAMTDGGCDALPRIKPGDHRAFLPKGRKARTNTVAVFDRFAKMITDGCKSLDKVPHHVTTWRFGEIRGSVRTEGANPVPFKLTLSHDAQGVPKIFHLQGTPPRKP